jgi:capsid assembly protease
MTVMTESTKMISALSIVERFINRPIALHPEWVAEPIVALANRLGSPRIIWSGGADARNHAEGAPAASLPPRASRTSDLAYGLIDGIAVIPVYGMLVHKLGVDGSLLGYTGYDYIRSAFLHAVTAPAVRAIMFDIDSPGGEVAGLFDLTDQIYRARSDKPIWAVLSENACSEAYAIAAATSRVTIPRTGTAGSIGIIAMHVDLSRALDAAGITVTLLKFGDRKADGNEMTPLGREARRRFQADIDSLGEMFVSTIARYRGRSSGAIRAQQAATYLGSEAIQAGLADALMSPSEAFAALATKARQDSRSGLIGRRASR